MRHLGPWVMLQLQPSNHDHFPIMSDSMHLSKDNSLPLLEAKIIGLICTKSKSFKDVNRHYWVVEYEDGSSYYAYDSLDGRCRLTQELARKLKVFGVLLAVGPPKNPVLRTKDLDLAAGVLQPMLRTNVPIKVAGRQRIQKVRNNLRRKLAGKPTPKKGVRKHTLKNPSTLRTCKKTIYDNVGTERVKKTSNTLRAKDAKKKPQKHIFFCSRAALIITIVAVFHQITTGRYPVTQLGTIQKTTNKKTQTHPNKQQPHQNRQGPQQKVRRVCPRRQAKR